MMNKTILLVAGAGLTAMIGIGRAAEPAEARQRLARCVIEARQTIPYRGPCLFQAEPSGSFTIDPPRGRRFVGDVTSVSLAVSGRGVGEVRGVTTDGIKSRWGRAARSSRDAACWVGADFRVCAY